MAYTSINQELNMASLITSERYLRVLDELSSSKSQEYSLLERKEWKTCLLHDEKGWKVTFIERGEDIEPRYYTDIKDACIDVINSIFPKYIAWIIRGKYLKRVGTSSTLIDNKSKIVMALQKIAML